MRPPFCICQGCGGGSLPSAKAHGVRLRMFDVFAAATEHRLKH